MSLKKRPVLRYHGGKWRIAKWIISHFPEHKIYVEPYGGAASVLLNKERSFAEVYNDIDDEIVNVFRILRNEEDAKKLIKLIALTPFSRTEFIDSYVTSPDPLIRAHKTIIKSFQGYSSDGVTRDHMTGFRGNNFKSGRYSAADWANYPYALRVIIDRLKTVCIENIDALKCIDKYDSENTLFYLDPPYVLGTRHKGNKTKSYRMELTDWDHEVLLRQILNLKGYIVISGFDNDLYNDYLGTWSKSTKASWGQSANGGSKKNTEILWIKPV